MSADLVRYDAMCAAIVACHQVDEVVQIKDQARALEVYAMQVKNTDAERQAGEIRLRAERRFGLLLEALGRATPQTASPNGRAGNHVASLDAIPASPYADALVRTKTSRQSAQRYRSLAKVPEAEFEQAMRAPDKPTTTGVLTLARNVAEPAPPNPKATWLWARMRDFEAMGFAHMGMATLLDSMTPAMQADVLRLAPVLSDYFGALRLETLDEQAAA